MIWLLLVLADITGLLAIVVIVYFLYLFNIDIIYRELHLWSP